MFPQRPTNFELIRRRSGSEIFIRVAFTGGMTTSDWLSSSSTNRSRGPALRDYRVKGRCALS